MHVVCQTSTEVDCFLYDRSSFGTKFGLNHAVDILNQHRIAGHVCVGDDVEFDTTEIGTECECGKAEGCV